jgi:hypothetical protein
MRHQEEEEEEEQQQQQKEQQEQNEEEQSSHLVHVEARRVENIDFCLQQATHFSRPVNVSDGLWRCMSFRLTHQHTTASQTALHSITQQHNNTATQHHNCITHGITKHSMSFRLTHKHHNIASQHNNTPASNTSASQHTASHSMTQLTFQQVPPTITTTQQHTTASHFSKFLRQTH